MRMVIGIGPGRSNQGLIAVGTINISGETVTAVGDESSAGIGRGWSYRAEMRIDSDFIGGGNIGVSTSLGHGSALRIRYGNIISGLH
jgi:hypothetical protein